MYGEIHLMTAPSPCRWEVTAYLGFSLSAVASCISGDLGGFCTRCPTPTQHPCFQSWSLRLESVGGIFRSTGFLLLQLENRNRRGEARECNLTSFSWVRDFGLGDVRQRIKSSPSLPEHTEPRQCYKKLDN